MSSVVGKYRRLKKNTNYLFIYYSCYLIVFVRSLSTYSINVSTAVYTVLYGHHRFFLSYQIISKNSTPFKKAKYVECLISYKSEWKNVPLIRLCLLERRGEQTKVPANVYKKLEEGKPNTKRSTKKCVFVCARGQRWEGSMHVHLAATWWTKPMLT